MEVLWNDNCPRTYPGYAVTVPSISVANIGQLAVDVLISSLKTEQIAILHHRALLPIVGSNAYEETSTGLSTSADLHVCHSHKLLLLQLRAPPARGRKTEFVSALCEFVESVLESSEDSSLWVLAGCTAANRGDAQLAGQPLRFYVSSSSASQMKDKLLKVGPPLLEEYENDSGEKQPFLPGAGFTKNLLDSCKLASSAALLMFVDEGENTKDAVTLAAYTLACLPADTPDDEVSSQKWQIPPSWKNMFGAPAPGSLFL